MSKVPCTNEDKQKSYYTFYDRDIYAGEPEKYARITDTSLDPKTALRIEDRNTLFDAFPDVDFGWWQLENGTALTANPTFFPGVTGEMFDWWFAWHPIDRLRYACWDNEDHYDVYLEDPARALDMSLSMRERHWDSIHHIWEDIGLPQGAGLLNIHFKEPGSLGYDASRIDTPDCNALICANVTIVGDDKTPDIPVVMTHFLKPVEGGSQLQSMFWFGYQIIDKKAVKCIPDGVTIPKEGPMALLNHNVKEFSNLAKILPDLYAQEKDYWTVS
ncbi:MAG: phloretin hydrolase [Eubacterium sp.]|nr:phloretin hydrolase [Eubacterium sp.]